MHDWMFEPGPDPLSLTLAEQPGSPDPGTAGWLSHAPADDFETWLFETQPKGDFEDFGPMFLGEEPPPEDDGASELDEVVVTGSRIERFPTAVQVTIGDHFELPSIEVSGGVGPRRQILTTPVKTARPIPWPMTLTTRSLVNLTVTVANTGRSSGAMTPEICIEPHWCPEPMTGSTGPPTRRPWGWTATVASWVWSIVIPRWSISEAADGYPPLTPAFTGATGRQPTDG